ncbi:MAG: hypothetical protein WA908_02175 [Pontixanthobacter sp.]
MATATAALICLAAFTAKAEPSKSDPQVSKPSLSYRLPAAKIAFGATWTLESCGTAEEPPKVSVTTGIKPVYFAGDRISLDPSGSFLVKRTVNLEYHPNGTLKSFNGTSEGQGGELIAAAIKTVGFLASGGLGKKLNETDEFPPPLTVPRCHEHIRELTEKLSKLTEARDSILLNLGKNTELMAMSTLAKLEEEITVVQSALTVTGKAIVVDPKSNQTEVARTLPEPALTAWYAKSDVDAARAQLTALGVTGLNGFQIAVKGSFAADANVPSASSSGRALWYREPAAYSATMTPIGEFSCPQANQPSHCAQAMAIRRASTQSLSVSVPQAGSARSLPFNGSGIFGNRSIAAEFSISGALTKAEYSSGSSAKSGANALTAGIAALTEIRDSNQAAIDRRIKMLKSEAELEKLLEEAVAQQNAGATP